MTGVFISYAREDLPFARRLHDALFAAGRDPAWDQDHAVVPFSAPYQSEIAAAIAGSEKFVFVISPDSLASGPCAAELAAAAESGKQVIPLLRRQPREGQPVAEAVGERNWIFFDDDARFEASVGELMETLDTDLEWVKAHTRLLVRAREWTDNGDRSRLLRGRDLRAVEAWMADGDAHPQTPPTSGQRAFIAASRRSADRTAWLQRSVLAAGLVIAVILASFAFVQRNQAIRQRDQAIYNQTIAEALQFGNSDIPLAAQLSVAAYRMQPGADRASRLIDTENTPLPVILSSNTGPIGSVTFSPNGHILASSNTDKSTVRLWNVADPAHPRMLGQPLTAGTDSVAFSPDGHMLATDLIDAVVLRDVTDPARPRILGSAASSLPDERVDAVALSPNGHMLASGNADGTVWLWNVADPAHPRPLGRHLNGGTSGYPVLFSPDGRTLAIGSPHGTTQLWDLADPTHPHAIGPPLSASTGTLSSVAFTPDGHTLAIGSPNGTILLWDVMDPARPHRLGPPLNAGTGTINTIAFSHDGHTLASGNAGGTILLWDVTDPDHPSAIGQPLTAGGAAVNSVTFTPDGHTLASGSDDGTIRLWSLPQTVISSNAGTVNAVAFSRDGHTLASGNANGTVQLWNVTDAAHPRSAGPPLIPIGPPGKPPGAVTSAAFSPNGQTLATINNRGTLSGPLSGPLHTSLRLWAVADPARPHQISEPVYGAGAVLESLAFSPNGHTLAISYNSYFSTILLLNVADPARPHTLGYTGEEPVHIYSMAFSPNGHVMAAGFDFLVSLLNVANPAHPHSLHALAAGSDVVNSLAFSPVGHLLASGNADGTVRLWDVTDPAHPRGVGSFRSSGSTAVNSVAFSPDGHLLASGDSDGTVRLWDVTDPAHPKSLSPPLAAGSAAVHSVAFSPTSHLLASGYGDGTIRLWNLSVDYAIKRICSTAGPLTPRQWNEYIHQLPYQATCTP
jgi:WD40 repeat protein